MTAPRKHDVVEPPGATLADDGGVDSSGLDHQRGVTEVSAEQRIEQPIPACQVCGTRAAVPRFAIERFASRVVVCAQCGLGSLHPLPSAAEVQAMYSATYYGEPRAGRKFTFAVEWLVRMVGARHVRFLSRGLPTGASVLDVGCGRGVMLVALGDRGFDVHGVELSADAARGAHPRAQIRIASTLADAGYPEASFDQIIVWHVLEHLRDPRSDLREMHRLLKPHGRLIVAVPNFASPQARWTGAAWFHLDPPRHLHHFPLSALRQLLTSVGFEVTSAHHFSLRQNPFGWIQSLLNLVPALPRNALYTLLHRRPADTAVPFDRWVRGWLWFMLASLAPLGLAAAVVESILRQGATVHVVARRNPR